MYGSEKVKCWCIVCILENLSKGHLIHQLKYVTSRVSNDPDRAKMSQVGPKMNLIGPHVTSQTSNDPTKT